MKRSTLYWKMKQLGIRIEDLLYKRSGLRGISGVSNDVRALLASERPLAAEAIEFFVYRVVREIGSLTAALGGLDALVFTAGIGENSPLIRWYSRCVLPTLSRPVNLRPTRHSADPPAEEESVPFVGQVIVVSAHGAVAGTTRTV
jgi:acetate kinase